MEPKTRFELVTFSLPRKRSTPELLGPSDRENFGAGDEARTRDPQLGRLMLYQLSYSRLEILDFRLAIFDWSDHAFQNPKSRIQNRYGARGRIRTYVRLSPAGFTARCH